MQNWGGCVCGGGGGVVNKVHYGRCASGIADEANKMTISVISENLSPIYV